MKIIFAFLMVLYSVSVDASVMKKSGGIGENFGGGAQLARLINEKNKKMAQLEQCAKKVNGFKIAGISTLGLTAAGVAGNVALSSKNKRLEREIDSTQTKLEEEQKKLDKINADVTAAEKLKQAQAKCKASEDMMWDNGECKPKTSSVTENSSGQSQDKQDSNSDTNVDTQTSVSGTDKQNKIYAAIHGLYEKYEAKCGITYPFLSDPNDTETQNTIAKLSSGCNLQDKSVDDCMKDEGLSETETIFNGVGVVCKKCGC